MADYARVLYGSDFLHLNEQNQLEVLRAISDRQRGDSFLYIDHGRNDPWLYTSEAGLKELDYNGNAFYRLPGLQEPVTAAAW